MPVYTIEDHTRNKSQELVQLFEALREHIFELADEGEIIEKANKIYIGYKHGKNFVEIHFQTKLLQIWLDIPYSELDDPYHLARDVSQIGHHGTGDTEVRLGVVGDIDKVMSLIEQSYQQTI